MIHFRLLGSVDLRAEDGSELRSIIAQPKPMAMLAYLAAATPAGYKRREEHEVATAGHPHALLVALGYAPVHAIDRDVEIYQLGDASVRLERYPDMDILVEVEGAPEAIERAIGVTGIGRDAFSAESLTDFVRRFEARTGRAATLAWP